MHATILYRCFQVPLRDCADIPWVVVHRHERPVVPQLFEERDDLAPILSVMRGCWAHDPDVRRSPVPPKSRVSLPTRGVFKEQPEL